MVKPMFLTGFSGQSVSMGSPGATAFSYGFVMAVRQNSYHRMAIPSCTIVCCNLYMTWNKKMAFLLGY